MYLTLMILINAVLVYFYITALENEKGMIISNIYIRRSFVRNCSCDEDEDDEAGVFVGVQIVLDGPVCLCFFSYSGQ